MQTSELVFSLPQFNDLSPYWQQYFKEVDIAVQENFWGNLPVLKQAAILKDPYIEQQIEMGYCFKDGEETPASFYNALKWIFNSLNHLIEKNILTANDVIWPAKAFEIKNEKNKNYEDNSEPQFIYIPVGGNVPENAEEVHILKTTDFTKMVSEGYFPIGTSYRAHTNQSVAEHDLAHFGGFISSPIYMKCIREGFRRVQMKMIENPKVKQALLDFDSIYSLRLYYMIEVFTIIPEECKSKLQALLEYPLNEPLSRNAIIKFLEEKAKDPSKLMHYLYKIYHEFPSLVNPVGGESRDILNRTRKFNRSSRLGTFYSDVSNLSSKFDGSSIYSLYQNGLAALENKRSNHPDFQLSLREIHAPFIGTLIGTSQLCIEDWVFQAVEEEPNSSSKIYQYLCNSGFWNRSHVIYWAYGEKDYTLLLKEDDMD